MKKLYDYVIFDLDGTLLDTTEGVTSAVRHTIEIEHLEKLPEKHLESFIGPPVQDSFRRVYGVDETRAQELADIFRNQYKEVDLLKAVPYKGIYAICERLQQAGVVMGVATYKRQDYAEKILKAFHFDKYSRYLYGADYENKLKKIDIIELCMKDMGVKDKSQVLMVGDSSHDAVGAEKTGIDFLGVTYGFEFKKEADVKKFKAIGAAGKPMEILNFIIREE